MLGWEGAFHGLVLGAPQRLDCEGREREEGNELGSVAAAWRMKRLSSHGVRKDGGAESRVGPVEAVMFSELTRRLAVSRERGELRLARRILAKELSPHFIYERVCVCVSVCV